MYRDERRRSSRGVLPVNDEMFESVRQLQADDAADDA